VDRTEAPSSGLQEWRRYPMLPLTGALGHATGAIHTFGFAAYIGPISEDMGWSRTLTTLGLTITMLVQALGAVPMGMLVDRFASRRIGLIGSLLTPLGLALLGTATGSEANWIFLWFVMACFAVPVQSTIWSSAIATRFHHSRGLALAVAMCGGSLAAALFPWMATILMGSVGWKSALVYQAAIWAALTFPVMFLFFRGARDGGGKGEGEDRGRRTPDLSGEAGMTLREGIRSPVYRRMLIAGTLFTLVVPTLSVNFIVIQTDGGIDAVSAAKIAGLIGMSSVVGRIGTGLLIDRLNAAVVGAAALLMPAVACAVLLFTGVTPMGVALAAILLGLTQGAEIDIFGYLTTRYFGLNSFGALFGGVLLSLSLGTGLGPVIASRIFDQTGSYSLFMGLSIACVIAASLCFAGLPRPGLLTTARPRD